MSVIQSWTSAHDMPTGHQEAFKSAGGWFDDVDHIHFVPKKRVRIFAKRNSESRNPHGPMIQFPVSGGVYFVDFHA